MGMTRRVLPLGLPLAIGYVGQLAISFTDAALVARLGPDELAGVTLALSVFSVTMLVGLGIVTAVTPKLASSYRADDMGAVRSWFVQGAWLAVFVGLLGVVVLMNTRNILTFIGLNATLADIAQDYNVGAAVGLPFFLLYVNARSLLTGVGRPRPATWVMLTAVLINLVVGYVFILGVGPVPGMGVFGAGLASTLVRAFVILTITILLFGGQFRELKLRSASLILRPAMLLELLRVGSWIGVRVLLGEGFLPVLAFFVSRFGADATAAHAIGLELETLVVVFALGFSGAATTAAAWAREDDDWRALRSLRSSLLLIGFVYSISVSVVIFAFSGFIAQVLFGLDDPKPEEMLHELLFFAVAYFIVDTLITILMGYFVGLLDMRLPTIVMAVGYWVVGLGAGLFLAEFTSLGFYGLWLGMITGASGILVISVARSEWHIRKIKAHSEVSNQT